METRISVSFDVAVPGMERLRNQDERIHISELSPAFTARDILAGLTFDLERDDSLFESVAAAMPCRASHEIESACAAIERQIVEMVEQFLKGATSGNLDKANPFDVEAPDDSGEGCSLFIYVASPLFRMVES